MKKLSIFSSKSVEEFIKDVELPFYYKRVSKDKNDPQIVNDDYYHLREDGDSIIEHRISIWEHVPESTDYDFSVRKYPSNKILFYTTESDDWIDKYEEISSEEFEKIKNHCINYIQGL